MIIEDGTGKTNSNSYVSVTDADSYLSARGLTSWESLDEDDKEVFLIKGTDFVNAVFKWRGKKASQEQALNFPRKDCIDNDGYTVEGVPKAVITAVCECAYIISQGTEMFTTQNENGAVTSEKIGDLSFTYDVSQKIKDSSVYDAINYRLRGLYIDTQKGGIYSGKIERV